MICKLGLGCAHRNRTDVCFQQASYDKVNILASSETCAALLTQADSDSPVNTNVRTSPALADPAGYSSSRFALLPPFMQRVDLVRHVKLKSKRHTEPKSESDAINAKTCA